LDPASTTSIHRVAEAAAYIRGSPRVQLKEKEKSFFDGGTNVWGSVSRGGSAGATAGTIVSVGLDALFEAIGTRTGLSYIRIFRVVKRKKICLTMHNPFL